jgi:hypothetical protein
MPAGTSPGHVPASPLGRSPILPRGVRSGRRAAAAAGVSADPKLGLRGCVPRSARVRLGHIGVESEFNHRGAWRKNHLEGVGLPFVDNTLRKCEELKRGYRRH